MAADQHEGKPPGNWKAFRDRAPHPVFIPLLASEWAADWAAYWLSRWAFLRMLDYLGRLTVLVAVIFYFAESGDRTQAKHYQAWQVINTAQGNQGNGGRIDALMQLNHDGVALVGVNVAGAFLQGVDLHGADLGRCDMSGADAREANLHSAKLELSNLTGSNFRGADLASANLTSATLNDADLADANCARADFHGAKMLRVDLRGANFAGATGLLDVADWTGSNIANVKNPPAGFTQWASAHGAISN